jgi:excinuclease ABC subunit B
MSARPPLRQQIAYNETHGISPTTDVLEGLRTDMRKAAENLEFEEAARRRDEVKRLEAVELAVADDPLARQQAVEKASEAAVGSRGRSTAGRPGQRGGNVKRRKKGA